MSFNKALAEYWGELQEICEMHSGQKPWLQRAAEQQACSSDTIIWWSERQHYLELHRLYHSHPSEVKPQTWICFTGRTLPLL